MIQPRESGQWSRSAPTGQVDHPASPEDQIQAGAVGNGCDWCPFFDPRGYRRIGTRVTSKARFA